MSRLSGTRPRPAQLGQAILVCIPAVVTTVVLYGLYYYLQGAWQLLALAAGGGLALAGLAFSLFLHRRQRAVAAAGALLVSLLAVVGAVPLFVEGFTPSIIATASLLMLVVGARVLPGRWPVWLALAAGFGLAAWLVERWPPLPRYAPDPSSLRGLYILGVSIAFLAVILWHSTLAPLPAFTSIRTRLFVTSLLLVLFTGGTVSYFSTVVLMHQEQDDAVAALSAVTERTAGELDAWAAQLRLNLHLFVHHGRPELNAALIPASAGQAAPDEALEHLRADLTDTADHTGLYDGLFLLDAGGRPILAVGASGVAPPHEAACLRQLGVDACVEPPRYYSALGRVAVVVVEPVLDGQGRAIGALAAYADGAALDRIVAASEGLGETGAAYVVAADHTVLSPPRVGQRADAPAQHPPGVWTRGVASALATRASGSGFYDDLRGVPVVGAYRWLPQLEVALVAEQDQSEAFQSSAALLDVHLGVTLILLTTAAVTALYMVRSITAPLGELAATAERIAGGAVDLTAAVEQNDEIGALAGAFNRMTARLRQARDQLEQRVAQRTEELARTNAELQAENAVRTRTEQAVQLERNKLKSILDAIEDGVYIVDQRYEVVYANPTLEGEFGPAGGRTCYAYLYGRAEPCPWCPNQRVWQGVTVRREEERPDGRSYEIYDRPLANADGTLSKLAIFHEVTAQRRAQAEILQRNRELAILSRQLVEIQERERHHISRELHDETGQALTSLMLRLGMLERDMQHGAAPAERVAELKHVLEEVLEGLHRLATDLRPPSLDHVGLVAALRQYVERLTGRYGLVVDFGTLGLDEERLPRDMEITIYRIVQEALLNVVRHARATHADVIVERRPDRVRVVVEDNGCGFEPAAALHSGRLGLLGMRERAEMLGGQLVVDSSPGSGATVLMEIPYGNQSADR